MEEVAEAKAQMKGRQGNRGNGRLGSEGNSGVEEAGALGDCRVKAENSEAHVKWMAVTAGWEATAEVPGMVRAGTGRTPAC